MSARRAALVAALCLALVSCAGTGDDVGTDVSAPGTSSTATSVPVTSTTALWNIASSTVPGAAGGTTATTVRPRVTTTTVPKCADDANKGPVTVLAASSMVNVLTELKDAWVAAHPCVTALNISYGSSATLAAQITTGAPADAFVSASDSTMNTVKNAGLAVIPPTVFARNKGTILLWPKSRFVDSVSSPVDLLDAVNPGIKVGLCVASAPCGSLANTILSNSRAFYGRADVTRTNIADTETGSVEDLVTKVELGELDAGIGYVSDCVYASPRGLATCAELPDGVNSSNNYLIAGLNAKANTRAFVDWVMSYAFGTTARTKYGFLSP
ncbi:MAG: molybdate ABC transporter substrate-binding protein [Actinobacteria bacterium]|nr:molybdate ABC transporter substrate-binding protein [Actinomycetota bacterium]